MSDDDRVEAEQEIKRIENVLFHVTDKDLSAYITICLNELRAILARPPSVST